MPEREAERHMALVGVERLDAHLRARRRGHERQEREEDDQAETTKLFVHAVHLQENARVTDIMIRDPRGRCNPRGFAASHAS